MANVSPGRLQSCVYGLTFCILALTPWCCFAKKISSRFVQLMHVKCANQIRRSTDLSSLATHEATTDPRDLERKTTLSNGSLSMFAWMCIFHFFVVHCAWWWGPRSTAMSPLQKTPKRRFTDSRSILLTLASYLLENSYLYIYQIFDKCKIFIQKLQEILETISGSHDRHSALKCIQPRSHSRTWRRHP